mgnify:CR=1 FL=1
MSSHNLPEVEKVCDRVGVIKDGRIIADKSMQDIRDMSIHVVNIVTDVPLNIPKTLKHVSITSQKGRHTILKVKGDLNPLLRLLATVPVRDLEVTHASLEDIFLEYYK